MALRRFEVKTLEIENPRLAHDPMLRQWWGRARRLLANPETSLEQINFAAHIDMEPVLSAVRVPTLVLHRRDNRVWGTSTRVEQRQPKSQTRA
jgi:hypothetical protein